MALISRKPFVHNVPGKAPVSLFRLLFIEAIDESCFYPRFYARKEVLRIKSNFTG